jgi:O-antigen ligase
VLKNALVTSHRMDQTVVPDRLPIHALLLIAALAAGMVAQGGFYLPGRILVAVLIAVALGAALLVPGPWIGLRALLVACGALASWVVIRAATGGRPAVALAALLTLGGLVSAVLVVQRIDSRLREACAVTAVAVGGLLAVTGWAGVALHWHRWAVDVGGLWRGGGPLTYPNALAALLAALSLLATGLLLARPGSLTRAATVYLLLVGLGATLSRAGLLALLIGFVVLVIAVDRRAVLIRVVPAAVGAVVAFSALAPSFPATAPARPLLAIAGMTVGLAITLASARVRAGVVVGGALAVGAALVWVATRVAGAGDTVRTLTERRVTVDSLGRSGAMRAAVDLVSDRPVFGAGPGQATFSWTAADGRMLSARYAHNEYLQVLVELGAVGLALVLAVMVTVAITVRRGRGSVLPKPLWAGAVAAIVALAVHSGFDFLWHLPVTLLLVGLLVGLAGPTPADASPYSQPSVKEAA